MIYAVLWAAIGAALFVRPDIEMTAAPVRIPTFVTLSDGSIPNAYDVCPRNKHGEARDFRLSLSAPGPLAIELEGDDGTIVAVPPDATHLQRIYVTAEPDDPAASAERTELRIWVEDTASGERAHRDGVFDGRGEPR